MLAIANASLKSILRSPSAIVFSFIFPFIFIIVFGFIGDSGGKSHFKVALSNESDTNNIMYRALANNGSITFKRYSNKDSLDEDLQKGRIVGVITIEKHADSSGSANNAWTIYPPLSALGDPSGYKPPYSIKFHTTTSSSDQWPQFTALIESTINKVSNEAYKGRPQIAKLDFDPNNENDLTRIRQYKTIDFILPGQLGFSLLSMGVFGVAFTFFALRDTLVLRDSLRPPLIEHR